MANELTEALERQAEPQESRTVRDLIEAMKPELERSLQSESAADILLRHYYSALRYNDLLLQCTPESMIAALLLSAQVRLEPGPLGHVYLIPFLNTKRRVHDVVWLLGYTGIVELARRGGATGLSSTVVWDCDDYEEPWEDERGVHWHRKPGPVEERTERVGVIVSWLEERKRSGVWCPPSRVDAAIGASRNPKAAELRDEDWYWRKTGVRFARPWLPLTTEAGAERFALASYADGAVVRDLDTDPEGGAQAVLDVEAAT